MNRLLALFGLLFAFSAQPLRAVDTRGATAGTWTYDVAAARQLADNTDRPLLVMFSNTSGKCAWCNKFEKEINASEEWKIYATEQQLALAFINYNGPNWDEDYYLSVCTSNQTAITGFPAFVLYTSDGTNVLTSFSFNSTNLTFTSAAFINLIDEALESGSYLLEGEDIWDHADDTAVGATVLAFQTYDQKQAHTLNKVEGTDTQQDTDDWFKFLCVKNRKYKFEVPSYDYSVVYSATVTNATTNTLINTNMPASYSVSTVTNAASTNWVSLGIVTNLLGTSYEPIYIPYGTNFLLQIATNAVATSTNFAPVTVFTNFTQTLHTNLSSESAGNTTNLPPPDAIVPTVTFYDPSRQTPLNMDAGPLGVTNCITLSSLTNGCVFTAPDVYVDSYCFLYIHQQFTNEFPSFGGTVYLPPSTNLEIRIAQTNSITYSGSREILSNAWILITISPPDIEYYSTVTSNLVTEMKIRTITNSVTALQQVAATNAVVTEGTNYVSYMYDSVSYKLHYRLWEPGEIVFSPAAVSVSEASSCVKLTVTRRNGSTGSAKVSYRFEDDTAQAGQDYTAVEGELFWADNQSGSTNITVALIQDLRPTWEGDERFGVVLQKHKDAPWFQAAVGAASNAVVTLKESAAKNAGKLAFSGFGDDQTPFANASKPAATVTEGESLKLWVARAGGSNGTASVTVSTASGTAAAGTAFTALAEPLTWDENEWGPKSVTIETLRQDPYNRDSTLTVRLSGASGAALGTPSAVTVTIRDEAVIYSLSDTAAAAAAVGATFKAGTSPWFWGDDGRSVLRGEPLTLGGKAVLQLTLTGPGQLSFDWEMSDWTDPDKLVCSGGILSGKTYMGDSGTSSVLVKAGKQTVTWTYTKATEAEAEAFAALKNLVWQPLPKATNPEPVNGARINPATLSWVSAAGTSVTLGGDFAVGTNGLAVTRTAVGASPKGNSVPNATGPLTFEALWNTGTPNFGSTYKWRVDTVFESGGERLVNTGDAWTFKAIDADENTGLPPEGESAPGVYEALQGVICDFGEITPAEDGITYALVGSKLPPGLKLTAATGKISGIPTHAGTWTVTLQATAKAGTTRVPYNTATFTITVYPLGTFAGSYTGWTTTGSDELPYSGSGTLTVSAVGDLSAKFVVAGATYSFSKKGLDSTDNPAAPTTVENGPCYGSSVTATDGVYANTLDALSIGTNGNLTATLTLYTLVRNSDGTKTATPTTHQVELFRNNWSDAYMKTLLSGFAGYYTVSLPVTAARNASAAPLGSGYVTMTVGSGGSVKLSGVLADGNAWSLATTLLYLGPVDTSDTETAGKTADIYVYTAPSGYSGNGGFCGRLRITADATLYGNVVDGSDDSGTLQWWNLTPTSVYGATGTAVTATSGFITAVTPAGGYYDTVMNLQTYYLNKTLTFRDSALASDPDTPTVDRLPADYDGRSGSSGYELLSGEEGLLPFGTALVVGAKSLAAVSKNVVSNDTDPAANSLVDCIDFAESTNVAGLTLSLTRATGLLSGSFNLVYERENADGAFVRRTRKTGIKGVHTPVRLRDSPDDPSAGIQGAGFYLIPETCAYLDATGRTVSYSFNGSYAFELLSEE